MNPFLVVPLQALAKLHVRHGVTTLRVGDHLRANNVLIQIKLFCYTVA